jgi:hypothetical protein
VAGNAGIGHAGKMFEQGNRGRLRHGKLLSDCDLTEESAIPTPTVIAQ